MTIFSSVWGILAVTLIILLHILGAYLPGLYGKIVKYVNICLHIPLCALLIYLGAPIEEGALVYMGSLFFYLLFGSFCHRTGKEEDK